MDSVFDDRRYLIPFRAVLLPQIFTDVLVIGEGVAGQRAALAAAEHGDVIIVAKGQLRDSNTYWAQGGIAAAVGDRTVTAVVCTHAHDDHVNQAPALADRIAAAGA